MKALVIGLGSMGKRRVRILGEMGIEACGTDSSPERREECVSLYGTEVFADLDTALAFANADAAVVCSPPLTHSEIIRKCLESGLHVFTEINLVSDGYDSNLALAESRSRVLYLSAPGLFRDDYRYIINAANSSQSPVNYIYHVGQYLPDWHPWESYKDFFVSDPRTSGCRELFAIEFPWLITAFGEIKDFSVMKSRNTSLGLSYNDNYTLLLEHENGNKGMLAIDVVSRKAVRRMELFSEDLYLTWDGNPDSLFTYDYQAKETKKVTFSAASEHADGYQSFTIENPFRAELEDFFTAIENPRNKPGWDFVRDKKVMELIGRIEC